MIMTICWILLVPRRFSNVLVQWWSKLTWAFLGGMDWNYQAINLKKHRGTRDLKPQLLASSCTKSSIFSITQHPLTDIPSGKEWLGHVLIRTMSCWTYFHDRPMIFPPYDFPTGGPTSFIWNGVPNFPESTCFSQYLLIPYPIVRINFYHYCSFYPAHDLPISSHMFNTHDMISPSILP